MMKKMLEKISILSIATVMGVSNVCVANGNMQIEHMSPTLMAPAGHSQIAETEVLKLEASVGTKITSDSEFRPFGNINAQYYMNLSDALDADQMSLNYGINLRLNESFITDNKIAGSAIANINVRYSGYDNIAVFSGLHFGVGISDFTDKSKLGAGLGLLGGASYFDEIYNLTLNLGVNVNYFYAGEEKHYIPSMIFSSVKFALPLETKQSAIFQLDLIVGSHDLRKLGGDEQTKYLLNLGGSVGYQLDSMWSGYVKYNMIIDELKKEDVKINHLVSLAVSANIDM